MMQFAQRACELYFVLLSYLLWETTNMNIQGYISLCVCILQHCILKTETGAADVVRCPCDSQVCFENIKMGSHYCFGVIGIRSNNLFGVSTSVQWRYSVVWQQQGEAEKTFVSEETNMTQYRFLHERNWFHFTWTIQCYLTLYPPKLFSCCASGSSECWILTQVDKVDTKKNIFDSISAQHQTKCYWKPQQCFSWELVLK